MSGIAVFITSPAAGSDVSRRATFSGGGSILPKLASDPTASFIPIGDPEPEPIEVDGERTYTFTLEYVAPSVTVDPFQTPAGTKDATYQLTVSGSASTPDASIYGMPRVRVGVDGGAFVDATMAGGAWTAQL